MGELPHEVGPISIGSRRVWPTLFLLIAAYVAFQLLLNPFTFASANTQWLYAILGATLMQPIVLGVGAALGPGRTTTRFPLFLALLLLTTLAGSVKRWNLLLNGVLVPLACHARFT